jgi:hypothetical protein
MGNQTREALAYIGREYKDVKGRVELQRHVVAQLHMIEADQRRASLNALLDDEASAAHLRLLAKVAGDNLGETRAIAPSFRARMVALGSSNHLR